MGRCSRGGVSTGQGGEGGGAKSNTLMGGVAGFNKGGAFKSVDADVDAVEWSLL